MPGDCSLTTSRHGPWSTIIFGSGATMGPGNSCMTCSVGMCAWWRANSGSPARESSIVNLSRPRKKGVHGYDAGKNVNGRKLHIVVDALGLILAVVVTR